MKFRVTYIILFNFHALLIFARSELVCFPKVCTNDRAAKIGGGRVFFGCMKIKGCAKIRGVRMAFWITQN